MDGILRHVLLFGACAFVEEELLIRVGWLYSWKLKRSEALLEIAGSLGAKIPVPLHCAEAGLSPTVLIVSNFPTSL